MVQIGEAKDKEDKEASEEKKISKKKESGLSASSVFNVNNNRIIADSGSSVHLTRNIESFSSLRKLTSPIMLNVANGKVLWATHIGNIEIEKSVDGKHWEKRIWENVYYSEGMSSESLFSTFMEMTKGYSFYHGDGIMLMDG